jgi:hypothetical protein
MVGHPALEIGSTLGAQLRNHPGLGGARLRITGENYQAFATSCRHSFIPVAAIKRDGMFRWPPLYDNTYYL